MIFRRDFTGLGKVRLDSKLCRCCFGRGDYGLFDLFVNLVDGLLNLDCLLKRSSDPAIGLDFFEGQYSPLPVFQPFFADLVAADVIDPDFGLGRKS